MSTIDSLPAPFRTALINAQRNHWAALEEPWTAMGQTREFAAADVLHALTDLAAAITGHEYAHVAREVSILASEGN